MWTEEQTEEQIWALKRKWNDMFIMRLQQIQICDLYYLVKRKKVCFLNDLSAINIDTYRHKLKPLTETAVL